jgi:hypothetical protein
MPELMITQSAELTARSFTMRRTTAQRERSAPYAVASLVAIRTTAIL